MFHDLLLLLGGLALIIEGGDFFVAAAIRIAESLRMPRVVIGSTLVSLTTTAPELVVSVTAGLKGEPGLAVGNAVGSVICNIGLILGVTAMIKHVDVHFHVLRRSLFVMFGVGVLLVLMGVLFWMLWTDRRLTRKEGVVLATIYVAYLTVLVTVTLARH